MCCRDAGATMQAIYCYKKALDLDPKDVDALWDRSVIFREIGEHLKVRLSGRSTEDFGR